MALNLRHLLVLPPALLLAGALAVSCADGGDFEPPAECGNGSVESGEQCDDGTANSDTEPDACRSNCQRAHCGDGVVDSGEECDDGNDDDGDGCHECQLTYICGNSQCEDALGETCANCQDDCCPCGDGECSLGETCEMCPRDCCPLCGNGELDPGEECDDGNNVSGDGCSAGCQIEGDGPECGNGILEIGEECDDGNTDNFDGCSDTCEWEFECGNGVCESQAGEHCQNCMEDCCPNCGDGVLDPGEECDGSALGGATCASTLCFSGGTLLCNANCSFNYVACMGEGSLCGDGTIECNEECEGSNLGGESCTSLGYVSGTLGCNSSCNFNVGGCTMPQTVLRTRFQNCGALTGWNFAGSWACGEPTSGPNAPYTLPNAIATNLSGHYPSGETYDTSYVETPEFIIPGAMQAELRFRAWVHTSTLHGFTVQVSADGGSTWQVPTETSPTHQSTIGGLPAWRGNFQTWSPYLVNLAAYSGESVKLRFAFHSTGTNFAGVYIDNVAVTSPESVLIETDRLPLVIVNEPVSAFVIKSGTAPSSFSIVANTNGGWLSINPTSGALTGTPAAGNVGPGSVTVRVQQIGNPSNVDDQVVSFVVRSVVQEFDFEACPGGWTLLTPWECGTPTVGPSAAFSGTGVLATLLGANYPHDMAWADATATSPVINLAGTTNPELRFRLWMSTQTAQDGANLSVSSGGGYTILQTSKPYNQTFDSQPAWAGYESSSGWQAVSADLSAYAGQSIQLRFAFRSDPPSTNSTGVYVDQMRVLN